MACAISHQKNAKFELTDSFWNSRFKSDLPDLVRGFAVTRVPAHKSWRLLKVRALAVLLL